MTQYYPKAVYTDPEDTKAYVIVHTAEEEADVREAHGLPPAEPEPEAPIADEKDAEIASLRAELEELRAEKDRRDAALAKAREAKKAKAEAEAAGEDDDAETPPDGEAA